jgi:hypothetical protein
MGCVQEGENLYHNGFQRRVFNLFYEDIGSLTFDLGQWRWNGKDYLVSYNVN